MNEKLPQGSFIVTTQQHVITVIGGTGFLGKYVVQQLARAGYRVRVVARNPEGALSLRTMGDVGQIALVAGNINNISTLIPALEGAYGVVNLVGLLAESGKQNFAAVHAQGAEKLAAAAKAAGVSRFVQISALGVDKAHGSSYARTKLLGEKAVVAAFPDATVLRPSVIFGPEDNFFNQFACMARFAPALPLIGGGHTKFQPVYVADVAHAVERAITHREYVGRTYELGGPSTYTFKQILEYILLLTVRSKPLVPLPFAIASALGTVNEIAHKIIPLIPLKLTHDQVNLLKNDNIVSPDALGFADIGIIPTALEVVVPEYLARFHKKVVA
jgi:uncharacterized protein YbjT (DUF2867 family)